MATLPSTLIQDILDYVAQLWQQLSQEPRWLAFVVGSLVALMQRSLLKVIVFFVGLGVFLHLTANGQFLGQIFQDVLLGYYAGLAVGLAGKLGLFFLRNVAPMFRGLLADEVPWMMLCVVAFGFALSWERHALPGQGARSLGVFLGDSYTWIIAHL